MEDNPPRARAEVHIAAYTRRTAADHDRLAAFLRGRCWPGGSGDRTEPVARGWLRQWGPGHAPAVAPACTCAHGLCALCN
jgi:hypothetical protein